ncbi:hypothetical protein [Solicola gregarius]|nr:hypothetical protein [Solicola gregarius]
MSSRTTGSQPAELRLIDPHRSVDQAYERGHSDDGKRRHFRTG